MASYHFSAKNVSRGKGQSAVHTAAYNSRSQFEFEREGRKTADYSKRSPVLFSGVFAPKDAPEWAHDRAKLWNMIENVETRKNSRLARNLEFSIPHELDQKRREWLVKDFVREAFVRKGLVADVNMHAPEKVADQRNVHVHCLITTRRIGPEGFGKTKTQDREFYQTEALESWREKWAEMGANALERAGFKIEAERFRFGHLDLGEQRSKALERGDIEFAEYCDRQPQMHKGPTATAKERRGQKSERLERAGTVEDANILRAELRAVEKELAALQADVAREFAAAGRGTTARADVAEQRSKQPEAKPASEKKQPANDRGSAPGSSAPSPGREIHQPAARSNTTAKPREGGKPERLTVNDPITGVAEGVASFVIGYLASLGGSPPPPANAAQEMARDRRALEAIHEIHDSISRGESLKPEDLRNLTPEHLEQIKSHGEAYLFEIMDDIDRASARYRGRERER